MSRLVNALKAKNIQTGYLYFYIHFITEVACFYFLSNIIGDSPFLWLCPLIYDSLAFVPQSLIGYFNDKISQINLSFAGIMLLVISLIFFNFGFGGKYASLIILSIGNALIHVNGAEVTLRCSNGKLSHSALFVSGGSFGVITGKIFASINIPYIFIIALCISAIPFIILSNEYVKEEKLKKNYKCTNFNYNSPKVNRYILIILAVFVVIVRGYMGYGIPVSWNKTVFQSILLYSFMGIGKALGGILSDAYGIKKVAILSILFSIPFLLFGDKIMIISLIGVMFFSMTMSITLAILVSALEKTPGLAFGLTTIGLYIGTVPIFIFKFTSIVSNLIIICILSLVCLIILKYIIKDDENVC